MKEHKTRKRFGQNFLQDTRIIADHISREITTDTKDGTELLRNAASSTLGTSGVVKIGRAHV